MNLIFAYNNTQSKKYLKDGHKFLGVGEDNHLNKVNVFLKKSCYDSINILSSLVEQRDSK